MNDEEFLASVTASLAALPGARGVALGGSRAQGTAHADSDWDFSIYYRGDFDVDGVRALGWEGSTTGLGGWGPLFDGGGAFRVHDRPIDVHYRDLDLIDRISAECDRGEFWTLPLLFHQAGIPSYILLAELAMNRVLAGELPHPPYPEALRASAPPRWRADAEITLFYAKNGHAKHGRVAQCAGLISTAACFGAHAVLARDGVWVTNEKQLLAKAGLREVDEVVAELGREPAGMMAAVDRASEIILGAI